MCNRVIFEDDLLILIISDQKYVIDLKSSSFYLAQKIVNFINNYKQRNMRLVISINSTTILKINNGIISLIIENKELEFDFDNFADIFTEVFCNYL